MDVQIFYIELQNYPLMTRADKVGMQNVTRVYLEFTKTAHEYLSCIIKFPVKQEFPLKYHKNVFR